MWRNRRHMTTTCAADLNCGPLAPRGDGVTRRAELPARRRPRRPRSPLPETALVAAADDPERAGADVRVGDDRQAADLVPAQALDLERVHRDCARRERAVAVVDVDRLADRF